MSAGTLSYNGYDFGPLVNVTAQAEPVYDDADRSVSYVRWTFTASNCVITAEAGDADAGEHFKRVREDLLLAGKAFEISDKGFGPDFEINSSGSSLKDINNGPKPRLLSWVPVGHTNSVEFEWQVEVCVPECVGGALIGLAAFNYSITWSINAKGFSTRTVSGYLEVAVNQELGILSDNADRYRDEIQVIPLPDYQRTQQFDLSLDKRRLAFSIVDTQIESINAFPPGVAEATARLSINRSRRSPSRANATISMSLELEPTQPLALAWQVFAAIVAAKIAIPQAAGKTIMLEDLSVDEPIMGTREYNFAAQYRFFDIDDWADALTNTGLFQGLTYSWDDWKTSMLDAQSLRGLSDLEHETSEDALTSLCNQEAPVIGDLYVPIIRPIGTLTQLCNTTPNADKSYVHWESSLKEVTKYNKAFGTSLGPVESIEEDFDVNEESATVSEVTGLPSLENTIAEAAPSQFWQWKGYAERLGYPIPDVGLENLDGADMQRVDGRVERKVKGKYYCVTLYTAVWNILYRVQERPLVVPDEPLSLDPNL